MNLRTRLILSFAVPFVILLGVASVVLVMMTSQTIGHLIDEEQRIVTELVADIADESYQLNQRRTVASGNMALHLVDGEVVLDEDAPTVVNAVDQTTRDTTRMTIPTMKWEGAAFSRDHDFVDTMTELMGGTFTVFQVIPQGLLRVSTSVFTTAGDRATGTYIPTTSPVYQAVSSGETFYGRAFVVDAWYITMYAPLYDVNGEFVGVVYSGVQEANLDSLRTKVLGIQLQQSGYVSIINGEGVLIIDPEREGESVVDEPYYETLTSQETGKLEFSVEGEPWVGYFDSVPQMNWHIVAKVPQAEINAPVNRVVTVLVVAMAALLVVTILISVIVGGYIVKPLIGVVAVADRVAAGDLSVDIDVKRKDEIGKLTESMKTMVGSLRSKGQSLERMAQKDLTVEIERASADDSLANSMVIMRDSLRSVLTEVQTAVDQVAAGSDQVSNASVALSQGATESASSLEEISSSVNQINGQARQNAEHATEAFGIAQQAASGADAGNAKMHQLQEAMTSISGSAEEINKIVKTIDDIAFQINLLALNANVEAARAGKYGKGFAVVAEEVRNLAVRSADAVKETSSVVEESLRNIGNGQELSEQTAEQLREITDGAGKVATFLQEIADASKEQSLAIEQVTEGLGQVDEVTQSNTASAEESASASEELASQAQILKRSVSEFRLSRNGAGHSDAGASLASPEKADETHEDRPAREKSAEPLRLK